MTDKLVWIAPDGTETPFDDEVGLTRVVVKGVDGRGMPPVAHLADEAPGLDGDVLRGVRVGARELAVPMLVRGDTREEVRASLRALVAAVSPARGDGAVAVRYADGTQRRLICRYLGGLEVEESGDLATRRTQRAMLIFRAGDPYWLGDPQAMRWEPGPPADFLGSPFLPLQLSPSSVQGDVIVENVGDVPAWPVWTATGPGSGLRLENTATGEVIDLAYTIGEGETVVIDTRPGVKSVRSSSDGSIFGSLSAASTLWSLPPGTTPVTCGMSDAGTGASLALVFTPRYLAA